MSPQNKRPLHTTADCGLMFRFNLIALFILIKSYARSLEATASTDEETFTPIITSLKGGKPGQIPFQMVPGFDPDLEKDGDLTSSLFDQLYDPADDDTAKELRLDTVNHSTLFNIPRLSASKLNFAQESKLTRTLSTSTTGSHMQGPRPAPKRISSVLQYTPIADPAPLAAPPRKNKEWFKRFKSKTIETIPADDEDADEADALVSGSGRIRSEKLEVSQERDADVDRQDEQAP